MRRLFQTGSVKSRAALLAAMSLCFVTGCYEHVSRGNESIYGFAWWLGPMIIAVGVVGFPIGWLVYKNWSERLGFALLILAPVLLVVVAPAMYSDRVLIDEEHFEARYGFWFAPTTHNLRFDDLREIQYVAVRGRRGRKKYELHCVSNAGDVSVVHAGNLVKNTVPEILARAQAKGVRVISQTP